MFRSSAGLVASRRALTASDPYADGPVDAHLEGTERTRRRLLEVKHGWGEVRFCHIIAFSSAAREPRCKRPPIVM